MTWLILIDLIPFAALGIVLGHLLTADSVGAGLGVHSPWGSQGWAVLAAWTVALVALAARAYQRDTKRV
ncbi:MAG TPA: hypothetical protein VF066_13740 [Thermoleophilaceae bacterium]